MIKSSTCSPHDMLLELVKARQHHSTSHPTEDVGPHSLHQRHEPFVFHDLHEAVKGALVLDRFSRSHHHASVNSVKRVSHQTSAESDSIAEVEGHDKAGIVSEDDWLESVIETKVAATIDNEANTGYHEASVQPNKPIALEGFSVHINESTELPLSALARLDIISKTGTGVI